jgi:fucose permease
MRALSEGSTGRPRVLACFAAFGIVWGAWGATLPAVQDAARVDDGELGTALLLIGAGALASMRPAGAILDRVGPAATPATLGLLAGALLLPGLADSMVGLCGALLALGIASGIVDVAINAEGVGSESAGGRPVLALAHGSFSAAVVVGSLLAGALREAGAGAEQALAATAAIVAVIAVAVLRTPAAAAAEHRRRGSLRGLPRPLLVLGGLCALAFFVENAWQSWGAVHLEDDLDASAATGALAPAVFAASAAASRFAAHALFERAGERALLRTGALVGAAGTVLGALLDGAGPVLVGIALAGAGISLCAPVLISLAGRGTTGSVRASAVSVVTTTAYLGFVVGPAAVGVLAQATTLPAALAAVGAVALAVVALAGRARAPATGSLGRPAVSPAAGP